MTPPLAAWGLTGTPVALHGGHRNIVLQVDDHVLKTTRRSEEAIEWLLPVAKHAIPCGFTVSAPLRSNKGDFVVEGWTCEGFCPGTPTPPTRIASAMQRFHATTSELSQRDGFASCKDLLSSQRGGDVDLDAMPRDLVEMCRSAWARIGGTETIIHGDLNPSNILTGADGTITIIDWDEARRDLPAFDQAIWQNPPDPPTRRATLAWEIACSWTIEPDHARRLARVFAD